MDLPFGAAAIARAVRAREIAPHEMAELALAALDGRRELRAVLTLCDADAPAPTADASAAATGPLAGVPLLVKDLFDTAGIRTTYGSRIHADHVPARSAPAVAALEAAGAVIVAKTALDEYAWGVTGANVHYGDAVNPRRPDRVTGGSSSGNAAALAAGLAPLALGTDTGGSVRLPAAACGVVGFKPALGAIPTAGVFPLAPSFDTVGPMARSVEDCALAWSVLTGRPVPEPGARGLRVGVLTAPPDLAPPDPAAPAPVRDERGLPLAAQLAELGASVVGEARLPVPEGDTWAVFYGEAARSHRATFPARREEYGPNIRAKLEQAQRVGEADYRSAALALASWRERARAEPDVDLLVSPALGLPDVPPAGVDELAVRIPFSAYARPFSYLGWPAVALGELQLAGRDEATVLAAALAWERAGSSRP
jgi:aspartyl-tRNA(Asn)/glutamyl-tRNA(Gln) amidotransferase subunit A